MQQDNFWTRFKVPFVGIVGALVMGLLPVLQPSNDAVTVVSVVMAGILALSSWFAKNLRGQVQSIVGIIFTVLVNVIPVLFAHGHLDWRTLSYMILSQIATLFFGYSMPPFKSYTYEHDATIVKAKTIPPVNYVEQTDIRTDK